MDRHLGSMLSLVIGSAALTAETAPFGIGPDPYRDRYDPFGRARPRYSLRLRGQVTHFETAKPLSKRAKRRARGKARTA